MRRLRWIVYLPAALIAFFASPVVAQDFITWTCYQNESWQMLQPIEDYQADLMPSWSDCERWRDGEPDDPWNWSYGISSTTTSIQMTTSSSSTLMPTTTEPTTTSSSELSTTTTQTESTTSQVATTELPKAETESFPEPTEAVSTTLESTTTSSLPESSPTSEMPDSSTSTVTTLREAENDESEASSLEPAAPSSTIELLEPLLDLETEDQKEAFEDQVNIFDGSHDDYVPLGSKITVGERRTLIAATTILMTLPTPTSRRRA